MPFGYLSKSLLLIHTYILWDLNGCWPTKASVERRLTFDSKLENTSGRCYHTVQYSKLLIYNSKYGSFNSIHASHCLKFYRNYNFLLVPYNKPENQMTIYFNTVFF